MLADVFQAYFMVFGGYEGKVFNNLINGKKIVNLD
jgi:hypothetical protein